MKSFSIVMGCILLMSPVFSQVDTLVLFDFEEPTLENSISVFGNSYLDGPMEVLNPNPFPSSINGSNQVLKYTKALNANWQAGLSISLAGKHIPDATYEICFDYLAYKSGVCYVDIDRSDAVDQNENATNAPYYSKIGEWATLCQKITLSPVQPLPPSSDPQEITDRAILIRPGYGQWGVGEEAVFYIDNIRVCYFSGEKNVTFSLNMLDYTTPFEQVFVSGTFNGWSGSALPLSDVDGDGIWEASIITKETYIEYLFTIDHWNDFEVFDETLSCISATADGQGGFYRNRFAVLDRDTALPVSCFQSCDDCPPTVLATWNLNMSNEIVSPDGVYLAGGAFGHGEHEMIDEDGDGIYTITLRQPAGFQSHYTFINGLCLQGWGCKEDLSGQACGDADNYYDRYLEPLYAPRVMNACFGYCSSQGLCEEEYLYQVTFNFDSRNLDHMSSVYLAGNTINYWNYIGHELQDGDGIYSMTLDLPVGPHEYKFVVNKSWEQLSSGAVCTITDDSGVYTNRLVEVVDEDIYLLPVVMNECVGYVAQEELYEVTYNFDSRNLAEQPTVFLAGTMNAWDYTGYELLDDDADGIYSLVLELPAGLHEYKFVVDNSWEELHTGDICTVTDATGLYINRYVEVIDEDLYLLPVSINECEGFSSTVGTVDESFFTVYPTIARDRIFIAAQTLNAEEITYTIFSSAGELVTTGELDGRSNETVLVNQLCQGMYIILLGIGQEQYTYRFFKS